MLHFVHRGRDQAHILALTELCKAFPNHPEWMSWYASAAMYADYLKEISKYTAPYNVLPASIYSDTEYVNVPESRKESFKKQVLNGIPLGEGHFLRLFPVWMDYRGHFGTILPQAQALINVGQLRDDLSAALLCEHQLEWIIGKNPFCESTMYGEGYDYAPLYTPSSGDMVGALPVGIETRDENDVPYWPVQSTWTYKEIWVHPVARWVWLLKDLYGTGRFKGKAPDVVKLQSLIDGKTTTIMPDPSTGSFTADIAEGNYVASCDGRQQKITVLPGCIVELDLRPENFLNIDVSSLRLEKNIVKIKATIIGAGWHHFQLRSYNLKIIKAPPDVESYH